MAKFYLNGIAQKAFFCVKNVKKIHSRSNCTLPKSKGLECLKNRSLLQIKGNETSEFLQGLITNDMRHFNDGIADIYALFLNTKGRVLYDTIIYKGYDHETYYIECDSEIINALQKHLTIYKIRRKIEIQSMVDKMKIWAVFDNNLTTNEIASKSKHRKTRLEGQIFPCGSLNQNSSVSIDDVVIYEDPRIPEHSFRVLSNINITEDEILQKLEPRILLDKQDLSYRQFRYQLGIGEGIQDLPPGKSFPLEINSDYLHGVSFHKGCYIGQELTARTYHTGVVRKRLMPLIFEEVQNNFNYDENIVDNNGKTVGKFRGVEGKYGLGLMRVSETINAQSLKILNKSLQVIKPCWWPVESQKEKIKVDDVK
ncbi:putative transferase CAF17 homolog, mitochondrial [Chelonus insularis]|uniref:putative transferase CAF17 homolog, mitochondrial n=1 Tax=Chelonus insularis TaxID=460826 RepID=UPI00158E80DB|nr:putative transferase CAF17 homolog, mitochondrial [Chelonus insularis]